MAFMPGLGDISEARRQLRLLRYVSFVEGGTLLMLLFIALPAKYLIGDPAITTFVAMAHGLAFLTYFWVLSRAVHLGRWSRQEITRLVLVAFVPFGTLGNEDLLRRQELALARFT